jgi:hypothetical protein
VRLFSTTFVGIELFGIFDEILYGKFSQLLITKKVLDESKFQSQVKIKLGRL